QAEQERSGDVDDERTPREQRVVAPLHGTVHQVPQRRADGRPDGDEQHGHDDRPTYRMTSTGSMMTSPSVTNSSSWGRNPRIRSSASTTTIATGRSSDSDSSRLVCMREEAPYPSMPRSTLAPARPARCARCTISVYNGLWCHWSSSPTKMVRRSAEPSSFI